MKLTVSTYITLIVVCRDVNKAKARALKAKAKARPLKAKAKARPLKAKAKAKARLNLQGRGIVKYTLWWKIAIKFYLINSRQSFT